MAWYIAVWEMITEVGGIEVSTEPLVAEGGLVDFSARCGVED
jgi:hypothetical protein